MNIENDRFDFATFLADQAEHSEKNFGPGVRTAGVVAHIRKELLEIEKDPTDAVEWIDVVLLALDGARRSGNLTPEQIIDTLMTKQSKNQRRVWPDWRTLPDDVPIEHVRRFYPSLEHCEVCAPQSERLQYHRCSTHMEE